MAKKQKQEKRLNPAEFAKRYDEHDRFKLLWVDTRPDLPLKPSSEVMRWDLRPDDWYSYWPEMLFHPCCYVFAPNHPMRDGPVSLMDFLRMLPDGYDWRASAPPERHEEIESTLAAMQADPGLAGPVGRALVPTGRMYTIDTTGRAFALGTLSLDSAGEPVAAGSPVPPARALEDGSTGGARSAALIERLAELLLNVPNEERSRLSDLMRVLVSAPDSPRTKSQIAEVLG